MQRHETPETKKTHFDLYRGFDNEVGSKASPKRCGPGRGAAWVPDLGMESAFFLLEGMWS